MAGAGLPAGTITFLFTDVEGSTALLQELGATAYAAALDNHRRLIRAACGAQGGVEVDAQGDSLFVAFPTAPGAVAAAVELTAALSGSGIDVRAGLHTGTPLLTDQGYVGIDVNRAARISAAGHGGQTLVSAATAALVPDADLRDLGLHWFKDLAAAERVFQLGQHEFPPLQSLYRTNLPTSPTSFLGRESELAAVTTLVEREHVRLVTLTGPGGTGKTRLALEAAATMSEGFPDGTYWVSLAPLREPSLVMSAIADAVGVREEAGRPIADGVLDRLSSGRLLLALDNAEHLLPEIALDVSTLVGAGATVLVTSRERLQIAGEHVWPVPALAGRDAQRLFVERALAVGADLEIDDVVVELCNRLDDLPLAVELTAARMTAFTPEQLLSRLGGRLDLLKGGRDADPRQRTLRAAIDWSYDLLSESDRALFVRLAVFAGEFTLEAAERICVCDLDTLASLVDKSLVRSAADRFWLLETIREYAQERLAGSPEFEPVCRAHGNYYLALGEEAERELTGLDQAAWLERLAAEHANLRLALERLAANGDAGSVLRLASSLVLFWFVRGFYTEGVEWLVRAVDAAEAESPALARALWGAGFLEILSGAPVEGAGHLERGLGVARRVGDRSSEARVLETQGLLAFFQNAIPEARTLLEESVEIARSVGDLWCLADALGTLGSIYPLQGDLERAERVGDEALGLARRVHDQQGTRMALFGLALTAMRAGRSATARERAAEGLAISRTIGDPWFTSYFLWILAAGSLDQREPDRARTEVDEALAVARAIGGELLIVCALDVSARIELEHDDLDAAGTRLDDALTVIATGSVPKSYVAAVHLTRAELARRRGSADQERDALTSSLASARDCSDTWAEELALDAIARLA